MKTLWDIHNWLIINMDALFTGFFLLATAMLSLMAIVASICALVIYLKGKSQ